MTIRFAMALLAVGSLVARTETLADQPQSPGCAKVVAILDQGGGLSPDEIAKQVGTDVETVRSCTDEWRRTMSRPGTAKGAAGAQQAMPPGCAKIVALLDQGSGGLSADEIAGKTNTDVETVRSCTDLWRQTMKGGANP